MSFFKDFLGIVEDIGTSATRLVTDTAIDLANVTTGFQFNDDMEKAKKKMSEAGIYSASDAIERNHYGFLKDMEKEAKEKHDKLVDAYKQGDNLVNKLNARNNDLKIMLDDIDLLNRRVRQANEILAKLQIYTYWQTVFQESDIELLPLSKINAYDTVWDDVAKSIAITMLGSDGLSAISGLGGLAAAAKAASLTKASRIASAAKFTKIGSIAAKASMVLTVASFGLEIGLSIAELESRKNKLKDYLEEVDEELVRADGEIDEFTKQLKDTESVIKKIYKTAELNCELDWPNWVSRETTRINTFRDQLVSLEGSIKRAEQIVTLNEDYSTQELTELIMSVEPMLSQDITLEIIEQIRIGIKVTSKEGLA